MHFWRDLIFDIFDADDRMKYLDSGRTLPVSHEVDPLAHAALCTEFRVGSLGTDGYLWSVSARVLLNTAATITEDGAGQPHPDVDFATLNECYDMMLRADTHARESSRPQAEPPSKPAAKKPIPKTKRHR